MVVGAASRGEASGRVRVVYHSDDDYCGAKTLGRFLPSVAMVQPTQPRNRNHGPIRCRLLFDSPSVWRVLVQGIVSTIFVMVVHVLADQPPKMCFVQRYDMVKHFAAATSYPAFRYAILPGRLDARSLGCQSRCLQKHDDISVEFRISVQNHISIRAGFWKGLAQLLHNPLCGRMSSDKIGRASCRESVESLV